MIDGFAHVGVSTHDMDKTVRFYREVLGCCVLADERMEIGGGGVVRQVSLGVGSEQYMVFMESKGVKGINEDYDTSINKTLGVPPGMYHYAFKVKTLEELEVIVQKITSIGVEVSEITDLDNARAVFLQDPNGIQLELSVKIRDFDSSDIGKISKADVADSE